MSGPQPGVPIHSQLGSRNPFHAVNQGHSTPLSDSEESDNMSTTSPAGHSNSPKRKNTLRKKVSKIKRSTRSLFRMTPKGDSDINDIAPKSDIVPDEPVKHSDPRPDSPCVSETVDAQGLPCEVPEKSVMESATMALINPLPVSESGDSKLFLPPPKNNISTDGYSDYRSSEPEITRTCTPELAELLHTQPMEPTELETELTRHALREKPKDVTDTTPRPPVLPETSPYVFGRFTYYQVTAFTLAAIGICVVVAPQTYRLLRLH